MRILKWFTARHWLEQFLIRNKVEICKHWNLSGNNTLQIIFYPLVDADEEKESFKISKSAELAINMLVWTSERRCGFANREFKFKINQPITRKESEQKQKSLREYYELANLAYW